LIIRADEEQIVPIGNLALLIVKLVKGSHIKFYQGGSHVLVATRKSTLNEDLLAIAKS
jgi:non-heme chloroperoxidase